MILSVLDVYNFISHYIFLPSINSYKCNLILGKPAKLFEKNNPDWLPTVNMGYEKKQCNTALFDRVVNRSTQKYLASQSLLEKPGENELQDMEIQTPIFNQTVPGFCNALCQTDFSLNVWNTFETDQTAATAQIHNLKKELSLLKIGTKEWFIDDNKARFYTGLPNVKVLIAFYDYVADAIPFENRSGLSKFEQMTMTLMRLRLNLTLTDLSYRFNISNSTTSLTFIKLLDIFFVFLQPLVKWPEREQLWKTTPMCFRKHFGTKIVVIIDCFEVFINKPKNILARAQTFSSYKHHNTVKFLLGITPQGVISFISKAWGGRTSDKHLTENCKLLNNLLPGDVIMADRGFEIEESATVYGATVKIPAFTKGKRQLDAIDVEQTRMIASVRIHVERVIGNVRNKFTILQDILPLDYLIRKDDSNYSTIDKIALVACALSNLCDSVIPFD